MSRGLEGADLFSTATPVLSRTTREVVTTALRGVEGIAEVRVLSPGQRPGSRRSKVFVVLATHDVRRDGRVVELLCQVPDVDFDLVPIAARTVIPDFAETMRLR